MAYEGARRRYGTPLPIAVENRLQEELAIIDRMQFSAYFLAVRAIVPREARTCGRGSAAASLVSYCLGLTNVCPVKHKLYFARFLNPGRKDPPDIDIDFAWDERDRILADVLRRPRRTCRHGQQPYPPPAADGDPGMRQDLRTVGQ